MATLANPVRLQRNDGTEEFVLKTETVQYRQSNGLVTDSVISALREVVGGKLVLEKEAYVISGIIKGVDPTHYPNSATYTDDDYGMKTELDRAGDTWGYDTTDGFDQMKWGRDPWRQGILTELMITEDATNPELGSGAYEFEVEWTYLDAYLE